MILKTKKTLPWTMDYHVWGAMLGGLSKALSKTQISHRTQRSIAGNLHGTACHCIFSIFLYI